MNDEQRDKTYREIADNFIDLANVKNDETEDLNLVSSAFLYGASRYSAFVVAAGSNELANYQSQRERAVEFFTSEFKRMLEENLEDYVRAFE